MTRVSFKSWLAYEAHQHGIKANAVFMRFARGFYPGLRRIKRNRRAFDVLVEADLARVIAPPQKSPVKIPAGKSALARPAQRLCDCGRVAVRKTCVCARCGKIERRLESDFHSGRAGLQNPAAKYFELFAA